jgi:hypothetical protein
MDKERAGLLALKQAELLALKQHLTESSLLPPFLTG